MATLDAAAMKRITDQAAKQGISTATVASTAASKGITTPVATTPWFSASRQAIQDKANWLPVKQTTPTYAANTATGVYKAPDVTKLTTNTLIPWAVKSTKIDTTKVNPATYKYWQDAIAWGINQQQRNLELWAWAAGAGLKDAASIQAELEKSASYKAMDEASRVRTAQDVFQKMWEYQAWQTDTTTPTTTPIETPTTTAWLLSDGTKALWYDKLSPESQKLFDALPEAEKQKLDNEFWEALNDDAMAVYEHKRTEEYLTSQRDLQIQIRDLNGDIQTIQASQRLKDAGKQVDNLIQNVNYLGQMWAPWVSSVHLQAQKTQIADAEQKFAQMKQIETDLAQIRALDNKVDTAAYEKQMADLNDQLNHQVSGAIQNALNDMSAADLAWQLDSVDKIDTFKRGLLVDLDNSIAKYSKWSSAQMQELTDYYRKIADQARTDIQTRQKNSNTVNTEMSTAKGFMVDGNGTPLYNAAGETIKVPAKPPMDPVFDKASGKLITFTTNAAGEIVGKAQQVIPEATFAQQTVNNYAKLINEGKLKMSDVPTDMQGSVANAMVNVPATPWVATPVTPETMATAISKLTTDPQYAVWTKLARGECGEFVNDFLKTQLWYTGNLVTNTWEEKQAIKNSDTPQEGSVAIITSTAHPANWHVAIVMKDNGNGTVHVKESNRANDKTIHERDIKKTDIYGYFDPTKATAWATEWWATYNSLPQEDQTYVDALANYSADLPSKMNKNYTKYISAAKEIDPNRDQNKYAARKKFLAWRAGGNDAANITSINTTVGHMSTLLDSVTWLGNDKVKIYNQFKNRAADQFWDPSITDFDTAAQAVGSELAKVFKWWQASPTEQEIAERAGIFTKAKSEDQLKAAVKQATKLLSSRMKSLTETYNRNIGKYPDESILYPETVHTLERLWFDPATFQWWAKEKAVDTSSAWWINFWWYKPSFIK